MSTTEDTYWILEWEQVMCLASAPRTTIIDRLAADGPMSVDDLSRVIGMKQTAVYHHIHKLEAVGLVVATDRRLLPGARKPQTLYATPAPRMRMARALGRKELRGGVTRCASAVLRQADREFADGFNLSPVHDGSDRNHGFGRQIARPSPEALEKINAHLNAIVELMWQSNTETGQPIAVSWAISPVSDDTNPKSKKGQLR
ncbi:helix-turn-helix domain-containing protein [Hyphobacterium sp. HN65]|uniref:Helix-turn-helix domain-containing protein n=1 Tax=Hyphobacterium lacteum TaxID=3116575 RepID=A0ABU7LQE3_9PROT|nr:helix-turn-helix domain-containing protein [Hyphobacterium sp. HN65]MEE2526136.1 helix-turn-helix domain-containing protein [Hyphobacterium sp. HN65]